MATRKNRKGRDDRGRFTHGNSGGPGGVRTRAFTLKQAAEGAITPEHIEAMIRKATRMGLEGNLSAMRLVLDRVVGRVTDAPKEPEPLQLELPRLDTAAQCNEALGRIIEGIVAGTVDREAATTILHALNTRLRAIEIQELESRITEMEAATKHTDRRIR
jgi:hypothetical protein